MELVFIEVEGRAAENPNVWLTKKLLIGLRLHCKSKTMEFYYDI